jgi:hypothetical protein
MANTQAASEFSLVGITGFKGIKIAKDVMVKKT